MSISGIGSRSSLVVQSLLDTRAQLDDLQRQLGTGLKSTNYADLGLDRGLVVGLRSKLASSASYADTTTSANGQYDRSYTLTYSAASAGQQLRLTWTQVTDTGNVTLNGVSLAVTLAANLPPVVTVPAAQTTTVSQPVTLARAPS